MLCDWLPPDFGAVGQYALQFARELAAGGETVVLVGFSSQPTSVEEMKLGSGRLTVHKLHRPAYDKRRFLRRATWTLRSNLALVQAALPYLRRSREVRFTGSPPYCIHFVVPLAKVLGIRTRYRITDFHPECLMAMLPSEPVWLRAVHRLTVFWRRRIDVIEALGEDQRRRLTALGIAPERVLLRRDPSPVRFDGARPAAPPRGLANRRRLLYSGNWGLAHEYETVVEGLARFERKHPGLVGVWLNATGPRVEIVAQALGRAGVTYVRTEPVPLDEVASVLLAADAHLITLDDRFVGFVLPSKVYACVESGRPVLFVGSEESDVHLVCSGSLDGTDYARVPVGDPDAVVAALERLFPAAEELPAVGFAQSGRR
jgi:hypothetical protein